MAWIFFLRTLLKSNAADLQGLDFLPSIWRPLHHTILKRQGKRASQLIWIISRKTGKKTLEKHWKFRIRNTPCRRNFLAVHHWREQFSTQTKQNQEITLGELNTPVMLQWLTVSHVPGFLPEASKQMRPGSWGIGHVLAQKQLEHVIRKIVMSLWDASVGLDDSPHQIEKAKYFGTRLCTLWVHCLDTTRYFWGISCFNRNLTDRFMFSFITTVETSESGSSFPFNFAWMFFWDPVMLFSRAAWSMAMYFFAKGEINFRGDQAIGELFSSPDRFSVRQLASWVSGDT